MALHVFVTESCQKDADGYAVTDVVNTAKERLEAAQRVVGFHDFPPPFIRKKFGTFRLLAARREYGEDTVIIFLRIFSRGSDDYRHFLDDRDGFREQRLLPLINESEVKRYIETRKAQNELPELPQPSAAEQTFLYHGLSFRNAQTGEITVCEAPMWIDAFTQKSLQNRLSEFNSALLELTESPDPTPGFRLFPVGSRQIVYRYFEQKRKLILLGVKPSDEAELSPELVSTYGSLVSSTDPESDEIGRYSRRTYPQLVLADDEAWFAIQQDGEANLALSYEETEVLFSADSNEDAAHGSSTGFPLFINGRAGSGKSTILQYLFSDYLAAYLSMDKRLPEPPAYFTYNTELLSRARSVVESLLKNGSSYLVAGGQKLELEREKEVLEGSFHQFHRFLHSLLPQGARQRRFRDTTEHYVTYARFKQLWEERFGRTVNARRDYGPDLSWHVIRSYIKGMSLEPGEPLDPEDYETLPHKRRTVTSSTFETVFGKVYLSWYQGLGDEGYWDDQDLAHALLEEGLSPRFPAIFCDEAQDFTPLELEVLYRLSIFSARTLPAHLSRRVPLAFAGDPFQTLNPTGFSWDAIKANYTTKLLDAANPEDSSGPQVNYRELVYNYRSSWPIVKLCNTLQALRSRLLDVSLTPQSTWSIERGGQNPMWFWVDDPSVREQLKDQSELTIIVPVDEGEEADYVRKDPLLSEIVVKDELGTPRNVLSPMRAKGLEFNRVALYGFGSAAPAELESLLEEKPIRSPEELLPLEYFVNRLYVAASRPKRRLFVVDSKEGLDGFWSFARHDPTHRKLQSTVKNSAVWDGKLGMLQMGLPNAWQEERDDPSDLAEKLHREGLGKADPFLLRQAALQFESFGNTLQAIICRAEALELEGEAERAAKRYLEARSPDRAVRALWKANDLATLGKLAREHELGNLLEVRFAELLDVETPPVDKGIGLLRDLHAAAVRDHDLQTRLLTELAWGERTMELALLLTRGDSEGERGKGTAVMVASLLTKVFDLNAALPLVPYAYIQYLAGNDEAALELWNEVGTSYGDLDYSRQRQSLDAAGSTYPESLELLADIEDWQTLTAEYESHKDDADAEQLNQQHLHLVMLGYLHQERHEEGTELISSLNEVGRLLALFSIVSQDEQSHGLANLLLSQLLRRLVETSALRTLAELVQRNDLLGKTSDLALRKRQKGMTDYLHSKRRTWYPYLLKLVARSDELTLHSKKHLKGLYGPVKNTLMDFRNKTWRSELTILEAGAVIERLGGEADALTFYERAQTQDGLSSTERSDAEVRWIAVKERQAREYKEQGNTNNAERAMRDTRQRRADIGLGAEEKLPHFPRLPQLLEPVPAAADSHPSKVGNLRDGEKSAITVSEEVPEPVAVGRAEAEMPRDRTGTPDDSSDGQVPQASRTPHFEAKADPASVYELIVADFALRYFPGTERVNVESRETGEQLALRRGRDPHTELNLQQIGDQSFLVTEWGVEVRQARGSIQLKWVESGVKVEFPVGEGDD